LWVRDCARIHLKLRCCVDPLCTWLSSSSSSSSSS
jgi:hypothetical protein